jgi:hypothetical protein
LLVFYAAVAVLSASLGWLQCDDKRHFLATAQLVDHEARHREQGLTKPTNSTKIDRMNCPNIRIALIISIIHRMVG